MDQPIKVRKLPVEVEAIQIRSDNGPAIEKWLNFPGQEKKCTVFYGEHDSEKPIDMPFSVDYVIISTLEGEMSGSPSDWIIRGVNGEFYPCKDDIFSKTYQAIPYDYSGDIEKRNVLLEPFNTADRHVVKAWKMMRDLRPEATMFISIENAEDIKGVAPIVSFRVQSDPIGEVGVNGVQAEDMLFFVNMLFQSLDMAFPCNENKQTILKITEALEWQLQRTANRVDRGVEGSNQA